MESKEPSRLQVDTSNRDKEFRPEQEGSSQDEEVTPRGSPKRTVQMLREQRDRFSKHTKSRENQGTSEVVFRSESDKALKSAEEGTDLMKRRQWRAATSCFDDMIDSCSQMLAAVYVDRSSTRAKLELWDGAASDAQFALTLYPESASAHFRLATAFLGQGKDLEAYQEFTKAAAIDQSVMTSGSRLQSLTTEELESVLADIKSLDMRAVGEEENDDGKFDESLLLQEADHNRMLTGKGSGTHTMRDTFSSIPSRDLVSSSSTLVRTNNVGGGPYKSVSVHLISGFVGSGKSTLAQHLAESSMVGKCVILTPLYEKNDEEDQKESSEEAHAEHFSNGSARIFLKNANSELLVKEAVQVAMSGRFDRVILELPCMDEPLLAASDLFLKRDEYVVVFSRLRIGIALRISY